MQSLFPQKLIKKKNSTVNTNGRFGLQNMQKINTDASRPDTQTVRSEKTQSDRSERPDKYEKDERPDRSEKDERPDRSEKALAHTSKRQGLQILFGEECAKWSYMQSQLSYVTPFHISVKMSQLANHYYGKNSKVKKVWDMFGGLGMDAINLAKYFKSIVVTEIDPKVFQCLQQNIQNLTLPVDNDKSDVEIEAYNQDAIAKFRERNFIHGIDLVYFDPPWGNSFKTGEPFDFDNITIVTNLNGKLVEQNIIDLLDKISNKVANIIIKSPVLSDSFERWAARKQVSILQICEFPTHKLKYLFLNNPNCNIKSTNINALTTATANGKSDTHFKEQNKLRKASKC